MRHPITTPGSGALAQAMIGSQGPGGIPAGSMEPPVIPLGNLQPGPPMILIGNLHGILSIPQTRLVLHHSSRVLSA